MAGRGDVEFSAATRRILAERVAWRCSVPGCPVITVGPGDSSGETANVGTAAHINSAALNGPRGRGGLSDEELASVENGIWCCANHGREIDTNGGRGYQVETLKDWKRAREQEAQRLRTGMSQPGVGWIQTITISRSPRFETRSSFELSKITIIDGNEAVGKTSLFEWICEAAGGRQAERWKGEEIRLDVRYSSPIPHRFEYSSNANGRDYRIDDVTFHLAPRDFQVVHVREEAVKARELPDDLLRIAGELGVDISVIRGLATEIIRNGSGYLSAIRFADRAQDPDSDESDPADCELLVTRTAAGFEQTYLSLSRSESFRIIVEFAAALARERARTSPTLLMIDGGGWNLSDGSWGEIIKLLLAQPYQSMLIVNYCERNSAEWNSCGRIYLRRPGKTDPSGRTVIEYRAVP